MANNAFIRVNKTHPCPICGKPDWCTYTEDVVVCMRVPSDKPLSSSYWAGVGWIHKLAGAEAANLKAHYKTDYQSNGKEAERLMNDDLHKIYKAVIAETVLQENHREDLLGRGLSREAIKRNKYRTLTLEDRSKLARGVMDRVRLDNLEGVPGFYLKKSQGGSLYWTCAGSPGILIPYTNPQGQIVGMQIRRDDSQEEIEGKKTGKKVHSKIPRYSWWSSSTDHHPERILGCSPGAPIGFSRPPADTINFPDVFVVTEGKLKADIAAELTGFQFLAFPGVSAWAKGEFNNFLKQLKPRLVIIAFDADAATNENVGKALASLFEYLNSKNINCKVFSWPEKMGKGIDDVLVGKYSNKIIAQINTLARAV